MTEVTVYLATKAAEWEVTIEATGNVITGGSNSYGSDEPAWTEVEDIELTLPNGKPLPRRMKAKLSAKDWDAIAEAIAEEY